MKVLRLTEQEFYFLRRAMDYLYVMVECADSLRVCYKNPDQHYVWPLKRIRQKMNDLNEKKNSQDKDKT